MTPERRNTPSKMVIPKILDLKKMGKKKRKKKICVMEKNWSTHNPRNQTRRRTKRTTNLPYFWAFLFPFFFLTRQNSVVWAMRSSQEELGIQLPPFTIVQAPKQKTNFCFRISGAFGQLRTLLAFFLFKGTVLEERSSCTSFSFLPFFFSSFLPAALVHLGQFCHNGGLRGTETVAGMH